MEGDILDLLLQLRKEQSTSTDLTLDNIKAIFMDILTAGSDSIAVTVIWSMTALMKNSKVMKKVQEEIRQSIGNKGIVDEDDIQNMPYFKAMIKETFRFYPPGPLLWPRKSMKKSTLEGDIDFKGQNFELIPFGAGRRGCPGISLGVTTVNLILSNLLYAFDWELPYGMMKEEIDTDGLPGLIMNKKNALCLVPKNYLYT
ncbi:hypothetical protein MTR67_003491 [Solanum verrucosum]|uniref:Cytochrome P450 n=1 Tax=Solanum verrucosum TaxID=315347 RepID=A0AAF0PWX8_SOLVR|nr:5-OH-xanthotoxin synthase-like [Solanum verrucosum]WMV10106.1 hypothetical protein MTR67_003491 [Solanum verrucosum]